MELEKRIKAFSALGKLLEDFIDNKSYPVNNWESDFVSKLELTAKNVQNTNAWFTEDNVRYAINAIALNLREDKLREWICLYPLTEFNREKIRKVGVVMAGNIPLVGFFDFFYVLMSGNRIIAKLSSQDKQLLPLLSSALNHIEPSFPDYITFTESQLKDIDAIIATGSDNTARYFDYYFSKYPNIIRKNRNSIAILSGYESQEELNLLGEDIFQYFGFGCRNISKLYVPEKYDLAKIFTAFEDKKEIINHFKYLNNYEYNKAIYLINQIPHLDNGFLLLKEDSSLHSPIGTLYYEYYKDDEDLNMKLKNNKDKIQCIVSNCYNQEETVKIGNAQHPGLNDYADGIDVMNFLHSI